MKRQPQSVNCKNRLTSLTARDGIYNGRRITDMSRTKIFATYVLLDLAIVAGVVWCVFQKIPVAKYLIPAAILLVLSGIWLVVMTVRNTPPDNG